jgi:hypothetical protein
VVIAGDTGKLTAGVVDQAEGICSLRRVYDALSGIRARARERDIVKESTWDSEFLWPGH